MADPQLSLRLETYSNGIVVYSTQHQPLEGERSPFFVNVVPHSLFAFLKPFMELIEVRGQYTETPTQAGWLVEPSEEVIKFLQTTQSLPLNTWVSDYKDGSHTASPTEVKFLSLLMTPDEQKEDGECGCRLHDLMARYIERRDGQLLKGETVKVPEMGKECFFNGVSLESE